VSGSRQAPRPLILVHTAHPQAVEHAGDGFGRLLSPRQFARAADTAETGIPWAADNDCFQGLDPVAYTRMLTAIHGLPGGLFVTVPDVVGDAQATLDLFDVWAERVRGTGLPVALVAQNGLTIFNAPWDRFDALFIGGTTEWKLSVDAHYLATYAKRTGKFLHMGRVNSRKRFDYARAIGCDSVDGSKFSKWRNTWLPDALGWHKEPYQQVMEAT
jgi:hypothetical protein